MSGLYFNNTENNLTLDTILELTDYGIDVSDVRPIGKVTIENYENIGSTSSIILPKRKNGTIYYTNTDPFHITLLCNLFNSPFNYNAQEKSYSFYILENSSVELKIPTYNQEDLLNNQFITIMPIFDNVRSRLHLFNSLMPLLKDRNYPLLWGRNEYEIKLNENGGIKKNEKGEWKFRIHYGKKDEIIINMRPDTRIYSCAFYENQNDSADLFWTAVSRKLGFIKQEIYSYPKIFRLSNPNLELYVGPGFTDGVRGITINTESWNITTKDLKSIEPKSLFTKPFSLENYSSIGSDDNAKVTSFRVSYHGQNLPKLLEYLKELNEGNPRPETFIKYNA
jgi:hypothetical protein